MRLYFRSTLNASLVAAMVARQQQEKSEKVASLWGFALALPEPAANDYPHA
jgi:hypothetical protein